MPYLVILKRFEVWLLLLIVVSLILFALRSEPEPTLSETPTSALIEPNDPNASEPTGPDDITPPVGLVIERVRATQSPGGQIIETTLFGRSPNAEALALDETHVKATTSDGEPVNRFFEPFRETATLFAAEDTTATLRWWVEGHPSSLWIEVAGQRLEAILP